MIQHCLQTMKDHNFSAVRFTMVTFRGKLQILSDTVAACCLIANLSYTVPHVRLYTLIKFHNFLKYSGIEQSTISTTE
jgi:hypothetical protein